MLNLRIKRKITFKIDYKEKTILLGLYIWVKVIPKRLKMAIEKKASTKQQQ